MQDAAEAEADAAAEAHSAIGGIGNQSNAAEAEAENAAEARRWVPRAGTSLTM